MAHASKRNTFDNNVSCLSLAEISSAAEASGVAVAARSRRSINANRRMAPRVIRCASIHRKLESASSYRRRQRMLSFALGGIGAELRYGDNKLGERKILEDS